MTVTEQNSTYETVSIRNKRLRQDTFSYGIDTVLIPIRYGQLRVFHPCLIFDNSQSLAADLPCPVNNARTDTDFYGYDTNRYGQDGQIRKPYP